jgi:HEAT repeat protein
MTGLVLAALLSAAPGAPSATDALEPETRETLGAYLGAIERPVRPEAWRALGAGAEAALAEIASSTSELPSRRARALEGLRAFGGARAEAIHLGSARDDRAPRLVRTTALRGLETLLSPERLHAELSPMLEDRDRAVRAAAAAALVRGAPAKGCAAVRAAAAKDEAGARRYARALRTCPAPPRAPVPR